MDYIVLRNRYNVKNNLDYYLKLMKHAAWRVRWDYGALGNGYGNYTQKEWNQTLISRFNDIYHRINKSIMGNKVTFKVVVSPEVFTILEDIDSLKLNSSGQYCLGNVVVEVDAYIPENIMLLIVNGVRSDIEHNKGVGVIIIDNLPSYGFIPYPKKPIKIKRKLSKYLLIN